MEYLGGAYEAGGASTLIARYRFRPFLLDITLAFSLHNRDILQYNRRACSHLMVPLKRPELGVQQRKQRHTRRGQLPRKARKAVVRWSLCLRSLLESSSSANLSPSMIKPTASVQIG